jgi:hypothetical protein
VTRYRQWPEASRRAGSDWRAVWFDKTEPDGRNEQFISTALGVETPAGYLGHVWPARLEEFAYGPPAARLPSDVRMRRLGVLSTKWLVTRDPNVPPAPGAEALLPAGVDGTAVVENPWARPRAFVPGLVVAVARDASGQRADALQKRLLDFPGFPIREGAVIALGSPEPPTADAWSAIDVLIVPSDSAWELELAAKARAANVEVIEGEATESLAQLVDRLAQRAGTRPSHAVEFARERSSTSRVRFAASDKGRWVVVSEPWFLYSDWRATTDSADTLAIRCADFMASAVFVPAGVNEIVARYDSGRTRTGLFCGALGAALLTFLAIFGWRRGSPA